MDRTGKSNIGRTRGISWFFVIILLAGQMVLWVGPGFSAEKAASGKPAYVEDEILVKFKDGVTDETKMNFHGRVNAKRVKEFKIVRGLELVKIPRTMTVEGAIRLYGESGDVLYAEPNYVAHTEVLPNDPSYSSLWGLQKINAAGAWNLSLGSSSVVVGTIDSGIDYNHPDLSANAWKNTLDCNKNGIDDDGNGYVDDCYGIDTLNHDSDPMDDNNHGTHVAGTIGAVGNNAVGVVGVNWNVSVVACKFLGSDGSGTMSGAIDCLEYFKAMKDKGANIVATNNSWCTVNYSGGPGPFSKAVYDAVEEHRKAGILFIAAACNFALDSDITPSYPASNYQSNIISVAATTSADTLASFSNYGARTVHLGAPGQSILSTAPGNNYAWMSGTSMAAPHVSGVAALIKAYNPQLDWKAIKNLILAGGDNVAALSKTITGKRLNARGALSCTSSPVMSRIMPVNNRVSTSIGMPIDLAILHINCASPNGDVSATVSPGGQTITLQDNGMGFDQDAGDGIYSGRWAPPSGGVYTMPFPDGHVLTVDSLKSYRVQSASSPYRTITGVSLNLGDNTTASVTSPFPILFGGSSYGQFTVSSNGTVSFSAPFSSSSHSAIPTTATDTLVAPFWDDLFPVTGTAQNVFWQATGSAPNRELVVEWRDVRHAYCNTDPSSVKFQVVFFENNSNILFNYADTSFGTSCRSYSGGGGATVGVQVARNVGKQFSYNSQSLNKSKSLLWTLIEDPNFSPPLLSAPADGATRVSRTPAFSWSAVPGAVTYRIMAAANQIDLPIGPWVDVCTNCVINATSATTSFTPTAELTLGTRYFWQVKVQGNAGEPGTWSQQSSFTTDPTFPPPSSSSPATGTKDVPTKPTFSWSAVPGVTAYRIMVATSLAALPSDPLATTCPDCLINTTSTTNSFTPTIALAPNTVYYWEVRAEGTFGGYWITKSSFTTIAIYPPSSLVGPSDGAIGVPIKPTLRWLEVIGAPRYRIMVATSRSILPNGPTDTRCNKCVVNTTAASTSYISSSSLSPGATYYWQVRAEGSSGEGGYWSQQRSFTTIPSNAGVINVTSVAPGAVINEHFVLVRGFVNVAPGTEIGVTVNNYPALVDAGQFALHVPLDQTVTALTAVVRDALGSILGSQTVPVTVQIPADEPTLTLIPRPVIGPAPLTVSFDMNCLEPISRIDFDSDGNGTTDFQGTTLNDKQFVYEVQGLFFPKVTVTDQANNIHTRTAIVWGTSQSELETLFLG